MKKEIMDRNDLRQRVHQEHLYLMLILEYCSRHLRRSSDRLQGTHGSHPLWKHTTSLHCSKATGHLPAKKKVNQLMAHLDYTPQIMK